MHPRAEDARTLARMGAADPQRATLVRTSTGWRFEQTQIVARPLDVVYAYFERPENLETITPPWLRFRIRTPSPVPMHVDARIDYALSLYGVPMRWRTRITEHRPGAGFVDEQEEGPFALWRHEHAFAPHERGTSVTDRVDFRPPLGVVGTVAHHVFVGSFVRRIFEYRRGRIAEVLERARR